MAVDVTDERLRAPVDDAHRTTGAQGEQRPVHLHREILSAAERAPDTREVKAHLVRQEAQARRDLIAVDVEVVDTEGRPVAALPPDKFTVMIDGRRRRVVSADFISYESRMSAGGTASIPRRIGRHRALWWALQDLRLDVRMALEWGLVDAIVPAAQP